MIHNGRQSERDDWQHGRSRHRSHLSQSSKRKAQCFLFPVHDKPRRRAAEQDTNARRTWGDVTRDVTQTRISLLQIRNMMFHACMVCWFTPARRRIRLGVELLRPPPLTLFALEDNQSSA